MTQFNLEDFRREEDQNGASRVVGAAGMWLLHVAKAAFILYSAAHGIHAALRYTADGAFGRIAQLVGVVVIELTLAALYLAWHNGRITGDSQRIAAGAVYVVAFAMACANIVADSQLNAGLLLQDWLAVYLRWWLPAAPAIAAAGALVVHSLAPEQVRLRRHAQQRDALTNEHFLAQLDIERAKLEELKTLHAMRLASRQAVLRNLSDFWKGEDAQRAIRDTALANMPQLLRDAGVLVEPDTPRPTQAQPSHNGRATTPA